MMKPLIVTKLKKLSLLTLIAFHSLAHGAGKPNIIGIFADGRGYGDLVTHGCTFCKTPRLNQMAKEGTDFQNFTVNHPVCSPSRTAVMTGQFPARHSVHRHFSSIANHVKAGMPDCLSPQAPFIARML